MNADQLNGFKPGPVFGPNRLLQYGLQYDSIFVHVEFYTFIFSTISIWFFVFKLHFPNCLLHICPFSVMLWQRWHFLSVSASACESVSLSYIRMHLCLFETIKASSTYPCEVCVTMQIVQSLHYLSVNLNYALSCP